MSIDEPATDGGSTVESGPASKSLSISIGGRPVSVKLLLASVSVIGLLISPLILPGFLLQILTLSLALAVFAISIDILWGYTGILTFGHAVFLGFGGYLMGKMLATLGTGPEVVYTGFLIGSVVPGALGLAIAGILFSRGISEDYFTIITLAFAIIAQQTAVSWSEVTNGANGLVVPGADVGIPLVFSVELSGIALYYLCLAALVGCYLFARRVVHSSFGRALVAIKQNELKAKSLGYNTKVYKTVVFGISSALAGFAGTLYVLSERFISPPLLGFVQSTDVLIWVLVGGRGTLIGGIIGTVFLRFFENAISSVFAFSWIFVLGVILIAIVLLAPGGFIQIIETIRNRVAARQEVNRSDRSTEDSK